MSNIGPFARRENSDTPSPEKDALSASTESSEVESADKKSRRAGFPEMQSAMRFPIKLPISVKSKTGESHTETQNISANGVLFQMVDSEMPIGSAVDFTISLPADVVGTDADVRLDCRGRVVRSFEDSGRRGVGVVIDEYRFDRAERRGTDG
jgi:PilZ domain